MVNLRAAGYDCIRIPWRDALLAGGQTFSDSFSTLSLHQNWQAPDKWGIGATFDGGLGQGGPFLGDFGSQWWINQFNPNTQFQVTMKQGAFMSAGSLAGVNAQASAWTSKIGTLTEVENFLDYTQSWANMAGSGTPVPYYAGVVAGGSTLMVSMPMASSVDDTSGAVAALNAIAAGTRDAAIKAIIQVYITNGFPSIILRPGWEMNETAAGDFPWCVGTTTSGGPTAASASAFVAAWRHIYQIVKAIPGITVKFSWSPGAGWSIGSGATSLYPGDDVVDYVDIDAYDNDSVTDPNYGLTAAAQFAVAHHKPFGTGELAPNFGQGLSAWPPYMTAVQTALTGVTGLVVDHMNLMVFDPNYGGDPIDNNNAPALTAIQNMLSAVASSTVANSSSNIQACGVGCYSNGIYQIQPSGTLDLGLQTIPSYMQSYINTTSNCNGGCSGTGGNLSYLGALLNAQNTNTQQFGYWQFTAAVDSVPGFDFQFDIESYNGTTNTNNPPEIDITIYTNADASKHLDVRIAGSSMLYTTTSLDITQPHTYGLSWQSDFVTLYIDGPQVAQVATSSLPASYSSGNPMFPYLLSAAHYRSNTNPTFTTSPYAHISAFSSWAKKPVVGTGCNSTTDIATCVANAQANNLGVILEHRGNEAIGTSNTCYYGAQANGLWYDSGGISNNTDGCGNAGTITPAQFQANWVSLATQFANNSTVIGAELHHEPTIAATARTGGGGGGGTFSVSGGNVIDPNGNVFRAYGMNISDWLMSASNATLSATQTLFPKLNFVRVVIGDGNCTDTSITNCNIALSTMEPIIQQWLNAGIVMMIDPHVGNGGTQGSSINFVNEATLLGEYAADLKNSPFLWIESGNELITPLSIEHANVYNAAHNAGAAITRSTGYPNHAVRNANGNLYLQIAGSVSTSVANVCTTAASAPSFGTGTVTDGSCQWQFLKTYPVGGTNGFNSIIVFNTVGGDAFPVGGAPDNPSTYNNMSNVMWDQHWYNWESCTMAGGDGSTNCNSFLTQMNNQATVNGYAATAVAQGKSYTTTLSGPMPTGFYESGFINYGNVSANNCGGGFTVGTLGNSFSCGTGQMVTAAESGSAVGSTGGAFWDWNFGGIFGGCSSCDLTSAAVNQGSSPATLFQFYGGYVQTMIASNSPGPINVTGPPPTLSWGGGGTNNSDLIQMCNTVGAAVHTANAKILIACPALINNSGNTLLSGTVKPSDCTGIGDLTAVPSFPMSSVPAAQRMYAADFWPQNVSGTGCVDSGPTMVADLNAYWGNLVKNAQAFVLAGVGCSCDGTASPSDAAYGAAIQSYLNGTATGGPSFTTSQQPISSVWWTWFFPASGGAGQNPDGILKTDGSGNLNTGQQQWWYSLLFNPASSPITGTAWSTTDQSNVTLSNNNKTATVTTSGTAAVRSTTSKTTGKVCEEFTLNTIGATSAVGLANPNFLLSQTLGANANGIGVIPNGTTTQSVLYNNASLTSLASTPSANGEAVTVCENLGTQQLWFTDAAMRTSKGAGAWNNSASCNPTVNACGLSFSGLTSPYLLAFNATGSQISSTTWNPSDLTSPGITLSNGNQTATSLGSGSGSVAVRATSSKNSGKECFEVTASTIGPNWTVGLANASFVLNTGPGLGSDTNGIGFDPNSPGPTPQGVFFNNNILSSGTTNSANGEAATMCQDFGAQLFWATTPTMRAAGNNWNNSTTANPATGTGGISTSGMTCPCFPIFNEINEVGVAVLNTAGPFAVTTPSGFSSWDTATSVLPVTTLNTAGPFAVSTPSGFVPWDQTTVASTLVAAPMVSP